MKKILFILTLVIILFLGCTENSSNNNKIIKNAEKYFEENYSDSGEFGEPSLTKEDFEKFRVDFTREGGWIGCKIDKVSIFLDSEGQVINSSERMLCAD